MAISGFPTITSINPTSPKLINANQSTVVQNTYYTLLNVTSGSGLVSGIRVGNGNININVRITVDGGTAEVFSLAKPAADAILTNATTAYIHTLNTLFYFKKSVLIEFANTSNTTNFDVIIEYALV